MECAGEMTMRSFETLSMHFVHRFRSYHDITYPFEDIFAPFSHVFVVICSPLCSISSQKARKISEEFPRKTQLRQEGYAGDNEEQTEQTSFFLNVFLKKIDIQAEWECTSIQRSRR